MLRSLTCVGHTFTRATNSLDNEFGKFGPIGPEGKSTDFADVIVAFVRCNYVIIAINFGNAHKHRHTHTQKLHQTSKQQSARMNMNIAAVVAHGLDALVERMGVD